ncbi:MAG: GNAT family N-acetyltransferase [Acutalibacteraceae bacterium]
MEKLNIQTERLIITKFESSMAHDVHINSLDEDTRRFLPDEYFETIEDAAETIEFLIGCYSGNDGPYVYPMLLKTGENIGYVQAVPLNDDGQWEIGYHVAKRYTGNGYATEAVKAFLPVVMSKLGINEIHGICHRDNVGSCKVLEKSGFTLIETVQGMYQGKSCIVSRYIYKL